MDVKIKTADMELFFSGDPGDMLAHLSAFYSYLEEVNKTRVYTKFLHKVLESGQGSVAGGSTWAGEMKPASCSGMSWPDISAAIKNGVLFYVGDRKLVTLLDGQELEMCITDVTDEYVRWDSTVCLDDTVQWSEDAGPARCYVDSDINGLLASIYSSLLPEDLKRVISLHERRTAAGGREEYFNAFLFTPAVSEMFSRSEISGGAESYEQLEYYRNPAHRRKMPVGKSCSYWLASVEDGGGFVYCVTSEGQVSKCMPDVRHYVPVSFVIRR